MHPSEEKLLLRQRIKERLSQLSSNDRAAESRSLCRRLMEALPPSPIVVAAYVPLKDEADIRHLLQQLLDRGDALYLPCFEGRLTFRRCTSLSTLEPGQFGIPEPAKNAEPLNSNDLAIALIPGRAFTKDGARIGRGNGGYDIWIREQRKLNPSTKFWGICLEAQAVDHMPMEAHDEKVDAVITARGKA